MSTLRARMESALKAVGDKPTDNSAASIKKAYSEKVSQAVALVIGDELRKRGLKEARPAPPGLIDASGAERRMAGGIGAKKVDVTWATEESGLLLGISVKTINFRDKRSKNFQKNLTNRRGDMLFESVTLHRRFPYCVLGGLFFLDKDAANDATSSRKSTFENAHARFGIFAGRDDPEGRDEQYEHFYIVLLDASKSQATYQVFAVGELAKPVSLESAIEDMLKTVAFRNPDFYRYDNGKLKRA